MIRIRDILLYMDRQPSQSRMPVYELGLTTFHAQLISKVTIGDQLQNELLAMVQAERASESCDRVLFKSTTNMLRMISIGQNPRKVYEDVFETGFLAETRR